MIIIISESESGIEYTVSTGSKTIGTIYAEIDGYYVFEPAKGNGYWNEGLLRAILNQLESMNKVWDDQVNEYFENDSRNTCINSRCTT